MTFHDYSNPPPFPFVKSAIPNRQSTIDIDSPNQTQRKLDHLSIINHDTQPVVSVSRRYHLGKHAALSALHHLLTSFGVSWNRRSPSTRGPSRGQPQEDYDSVRACMRLFLCITSPAYGSKCRAVCIATNIYIYEDLFVVIRHTHLQAPAIHGPPNSRHMIHR